MDFAVLQNVLFVHACAVCVQYRTSSGIYFQCVYIFLFVCMRLISVCLCVFRLALACTCMLVNVCVCCTHTWFSWHSYFRLPVRDAFFVCFLDVRVFLRVCLCVCVRARYVYSYFQLSSWILCTSTITISRSTQWLCMFLNGVEPHSFFRHFASVCASESVHARGLIKIILCHLTTQGCKYLWEWQWLLTLSSSLINW